MDAIGKWMLYLLLIFLVVAVLTHPSGFSQSAGSLFSLFIEGLQKT